MASYYKKSKLSTKHGYNTESSLTLSTIVNLGQLNKMRQNYIRLSKYLQFKIFYSLLSIGSGTTTRHAVRGNKYAKQHHSII